MLPAARSAFARKSARRDSAGYYMRHVAITYARAYAPGATLPLRHTLHRHIAMRRARCLRCLPPRAYLRAMRARCFAAEMPRRYDASAVILMLPRCLRAADARDLFSCCAERLCRVPPQCRCHAYDVTSCRYELRRR